MQKPRPVLQPRACLDVWTHPVALSSDDPAMNAPTLLMIVDFAGGSCRLLCAGSLWGLQSLCPCCCLPPLPSLPTLQPRQVREPALGVALTVQSGPADWFDAPPLVLLPRVGFQGSLTPCVPRSRCAQFFALSCLPGTLSGRAFLRTLPRRPSNRR